ncbi:MAG TPA: ATP-binding cassette domain-containing protein, partial [Thermotogales bacterium]|nr:ATP-binding cassette domain-containing protein [Thermotogales bacterium]
MKGSIFMDHHILMKNVWKKFGEITALRDANLMVKKNTIHAIVGENSAGKSTLVRILAGIERMDKGEIWISGRKVKIRSARDSLKLGIGMVHQHLALIEDFTVAENLFAVGMDDPLNIVTKRRLRQNATKIMERFQMNLNPDSKVSSLSLGEKQKVEILRVLKDEPKIIILDEPTSLLNDMEAEDIL